MAEMKKTHVAVLPSPGMGHLIPLVEFSKRLVSLHNISITFNVSLKMNVVMLTEDIKGEDGQKVCYRMKDLKEAAANVLSHDGSSTTALAEVVLAE
ncbi:hypothetical protein SLEP1_g2290 [Rubroshorea leprosula]|uniref:Uncharacterized protein n=1 Tax=Rubroshorea leprosula TaxID=152421 RepID=A0AAV5HGN7_9ROSI|nr:hypothetical protein SLEP1_g2290 [Rubroshorea leprosula]